MYPARRHVYPSPLMGAFQLLAAPFRAGRWLTRSYGDIGLKGSYQGSPLATEAIRQHMLANPPAPEAPAPVDVEDDRTLVLLGYGFIALLAVITVIGLLNGA